MRENFTCGLAMLAALLLFAVPTQAQFTPGNIVVVRVGDGSTMTASAATATFLDEYTTTGTLVQSVALPTADAGANQILTLSSTATSEGLLNRSANKEYLILTGYDAAPGTASIAGTNAATVNRTVALIKYDETINTSTALSDYSDGNNPRSAISTNGTDLWVAGATGGIRYTTSGSSTSTQLATTPTNLRDVKLYNGQLYISTSSGSSVRIGIVGSGIPTSSGQTITNLSGIPNSSGNPYQFFFADLNASVSGLDVLYIADDDLAIRKFSLVSGTWTANGTIGVNGDDYRGLTGVVSGPNVTLYAVRKGGSTAGGGGEIVSLTDATGYNATISATPTLLATAPTNTSFRGIAFAPEACPTITVGAGPDMIPCASSTSLTLNASDATGGTSPYSYRWDNGLGSGQTVSTGTSTQTYTVTATDANYCSGSDAMMVLATSTLDYSNSTTTVATDGATHTADGYCNDLTWTHYFEGTEIVLSVAKSHWNIGTIGDGTFAVSSAGSSGISHILNANAPYVTNPGWYVMNRHWQVTPNPQPGADVTIRTYYQTGDYTTLNAQTGTSAHTAMRFYKINNGDPNPALGHAGISYAATYSDDGYWEYTHAGAASSSNWAYNSLNANTHYAEYIVSEFSGGGGGGAPLDGGALPIATIQLEAEAYDNAVTLSWLVSGETDGNGFELLRSLNGQPFESLQQTAANEEKAYTATDMLPAQLTGNVVYQVRSRNAAGNEVLSNTATLFRQAASALHVQISPNPCLGPLTISANQPGMHIRLMDATGRKVAEYQVGANSFQTVLATESLPAGHYRLLIETETSTAHGSFVKLP